MIFIDKNGKELTLTDQKQEILKDAISAKKIYRYLLYPNFSSNVIIRDDADEKMIYFVLSGVYLGKNIVLDDRLSGEKYEFDYKVFCHDILRYKEEVSL